MADMYVLLKFSPSCSFQSMIFYILVYIMQFIDKILLTNDCELSRICSGHETMTCASPCAAQLQETQL